MNYACIYAEFVSDRLTKQPESTQYFENHHIKPRSLGGGNEKENMIRLTPEDHLFAHLLLAKIYGGRLWGAVFLMSGNRGRGRNRGLQRSTRKIRSAYGMAKREWSEIERGKDGLKGSDNGNYNATVFQWLNLDTGKRESGTLHNMWKKHGGSRGTWTSAITPDSGKPSAAGWTLDDGIRKLRSLKGQIFDFVNRDGRMFSGTQNEFCAIAGVFPSAATRIVRYESVTLCGWRLKSTKDRAVWGRKSNGKAGNDELGRFYIAQKDGRTIKGPRHKVAKVIGVTAGALGAIATTMLKGRKRGQFYKGWSIQWQDSLF